MTLKKLFLSVNNEMKKRVHLKNMRPIINKYNNIDWKKYVYFDNNKYNRNTVYKNENIEMVIISWNNNQKSGLHDHPKNGCLMKILDGELNEYIYNEKLNLLKINNCKKDCISYQEGKNGIHDIINKNNKTVSLHIYSPPNHDITRY